jgi:hypothetical protein
LIDASCGHFGVLRSTLFESLTSDESQGSACDQEHPVPYSSNIIL